LLEREPRQGRLAEHRRREETIEHPIYVILHLADDGGGSGDFRDFHRFLLSEICLPYIRFD
jgi:hypothetical protein